MVKTHKFVLAIIQRDYITGTNRPTVSSEWLIMLLMREMMQIDMEIYLS